ncbi:hypothetical protein KQX54_018854 [Cotesia glomerata]|uniref:PHD-type domain-containing protein n=1 Tax=Cotesia glomerata TaxID=32391 RepID=A0AAV7IR74_COTGL|nr:hypothetical protein KQX54_018854 [Cotesia glomerata]
MPTVLKCVMTDKDLVERKAIKEVFSHVSMYLCLFHTLKSFSKQIKTKEMQITGEDKDKCLSILQSLAYSSSPEEYNKIYAKFCEQAPTSVIDYFNKNWHNIRDERTSYTMINGNLDNKTNNWLENSNGKLKQVLGIENTLIEFINSFFIWDRSHNIASATKAMKNFYTRPSVNNYSPCEQLYSEILTNKAFEYVQKELKAADFVTILHSDLHTHHCTIQSKSSSINDIVDPVQHIQLPTVIKNKGRPKGSSLTAIGRFKAKALLAYIEKKKIDKVKTTMKWLLLPNELIEASMNNEHKIKLKDLTITGSTIGDSFMEVNVNIDLLKNYCTEEVWEKIAQWVNDKRTKNIFHCSKCQEICGEKTVFCDCCCCWYDFDCVKISKIPRTKYWFCPDCRESQI